MSRSFALRVAATACIAAVAAALGLAGQAAASTQARPKVATGAVHVHGTTLDLGGLVDPRGAATTYYFQYGPTSAYGMLTATGSLPATTTSKVGVQEPAPGLAVGYHFRLVAMNAGGTAYGADHTYTVKVKSKGKGKVKVNLTAPSAPVTLGGTVLLGGEVSGAGSTIYSVVLEDSPYPYREAFKAVGGPQPTEPGGRFSFRVSHLTASTRFRVVTVGAKPLESGTITAEVEVRVSLSVRTSSKAPGVVRLYGLISPAEVGAQVFIEIEKKPKPKTSVKPLKSEKAEERASQAEEAGRFASVATTVSKRSTKTYSRFSRVLTVRTTGRYRVLVAVPKGPLVSGYSREITLHAAPGTASKAKKKGKKG